MELSTVKRQEVSCRSPSPSNSTASSSTECRDVCCDSVSEAIDIGEEYCKPSDVIIAPTVPPSVSAIKKNQMDNDYRTLRISHLIVTLVIMLADGLQGTHLYVLYEGYGFSVAQLYCLGFLTGAATTPITGPLVDMIGYKKSAIIYCVLEMLINQLEQYPNYFGLFASRMMGGLTTNLLSTVFESWLDAEYRRRGLEKEKYELIMRDSVIVSNLAAIFSGYLAHVLATTYGAEGPFRGAVTCTAIALAVVIAVWTENYGSSESTISVQSIRSCIKEAVSAFRNDKQMTKVGFLQGLTTASLHIFVFLWSPTLRRFSSSAPPGTFGREDDGEPAFGLIFGAFMFAGVLGGCIAPPIRQFFSTALTPNDDSGVVVSTVEIEGEGEVRPMAVELLATSCYLLAAAMLAVPSFMSEDDPSAFSICLVAFMFYELLIGIYMPCEGVIRSLYFPPQARASVMMLPRIVVNIAVSAGVVSTEFVSLSTALSAVICLMITASLLQISFLSGQDFCVLFGFFKNLAKSGFSRSSCKSSSTSTSMARSQVRPSIAASESSVSTMSVEDMDEFDDSSFFFNDPSSLHKED